MAPGAGSCRRLIKGFGVGIADINEFDALRMHLDGVEMIAGYTAAANYGEPDLPVSNYRIVMHGMWGAA